MNVSSDSDPRIHQKQRTRRAIVEAAMAMLATGIRPTVPEAAAAARVSRATAYRYFPTQDALLAEAAASRPVESIDALLQGMPAAPPQARLVRLQAAANRLMLKEEPAMRAALRSYMDAWFEGRARGEARPEVREGRRMRWIATALGTELAALDPARARRLQAALALTLGVEALVVMKDVCRLDDDAACEVLEWAAQALLNASLSGGGK